MRTEICQRQLIIWLSILSLNTRLLEKEFQNTSLWKKKPEVEQYVKGS